MMKQVCLLTAMISMVVLTSCGLLQSDERTLRLQVKNYETLLSKSDWVKAGEMYADDFQWIVFDNRRYRGRSPVRAFHKSLAEIRNHDTMLVDITRVKKLAAGKYLITGFMQMRQAEAGTLRSVRWDMSMTWIKTRDGWKILEIKELEKRKNFAS